MSKSCKEAMDDYLYPRIKLVEPACDCSKADLKEFGFCLCGTPTAPKKDSQLTVSKDRVTNNDLYQEFLDLLIGELPKKP